MEVPIFDKSRPDQTPQPTATVKPAVAAPVEKTRTVRNPSSHLGKSVNISGEVIAEEDISVAGHVTGSLTVDNNLAQIADTGHIEGNIRAANIRIDGKVKGDLMATDKVVIGNTGNVEGDIKAPRVNLDDGARFQGRIDMDPSADDPQPQSERKTQTASAQTATRPSVPSSSSATSPGKTSATAKSQTPTRS